MRRALVTGGASPIGAAICRALAAQGHEVIVHFALQGETLSGRLRSHLSLPAPGERITLIVKTEAMHLFDPVTEQRLR